MVAEIGARPREIEALEDADINCLDSIVSIDPKGLIWTSNRSA